MKYFLRNIVLAASCLWISAACNDFLTLYPEDDIVDNEYWKTGEDVQSMVASCYRFMLEDNVISRMIYWGEVRSDNMDYSTSASTEEQYLKDANLMSSNSLVTWGDFYKVINICNKVIKTAPGVCDRDVNFTEERLHNYMAEAYTLRALCYFYLIRSFGDVPYVTEPSESEQQDYQVAQSSADEVIVPALIEDLKLAEEYATEEWPTERYTRGRITKNGVRVLLADVYLWKASDKDNPEAKADYQACVDACNRVLHNQALYETEMMMVEGDVMYNSVFYNGNSTETVFELNFDADGKMNGATANVYGNTVKGKSAHFEPTVQLFNAYLNVQRDCRARDFIAATVDAAPGGNAVPGANFRVFKYEGQSPAQSFIPHTLDEYRYRAANSTANWILYRLSDLYLMKAEALAELAVTDEERKAVISLCNVTYKRATMEMDSLEYADYPSMDEVKAMVLQERQRELCFEGKRWYDLLRKVRREGATAGAYALLEKAYAREVSTYKARLSNPEAWYLPISLTEMNANTQLYQNSYYATKEQ